MTIPLRVYEDNAAIRVAHAAATVGVPTGIGGSPSCPTGNRVLTIYQVAGETYVCLPGVTVVYDSDAFNLAVKCRENAILEGTTDYQYSSYLMDMIGNPRDKPEE